MSLPVLKQAGKKRLSSFLKLELNPDYCREEYTLLGGVGAARTVIIGQLLAKAIADGGVAVSALADGGNTGNGTITLANPAYTDAVKEGDYIAVCVTGGGDGVAKFRVEKPNGQHLTDVTVGTAFDGQIKFTIVAGAADFVVGDKFTISAVIATESAANKVVAWTPDMGAEEIWGAAINDVTAGIGVDNGSGLAVRRGAVFNAAEVIWPDGIDAADKDNALKWLNILGIVCR